MKRVLFVFFVVAALLLSLAGTVAAAPPADNPGKGPPGPFDTPPGFEEGNQSEQAEAAIDAHKPITPGGQFARLVLVHYAKPPWAGKPDEEEKPKDYDAYALSGVSWVVPAGGIPYVIDPDYAPAGSIVEIELAYEAWDDATSVELFAEPSVNASVSPSLDGPDFVNTVSWRRIVPPKVIAVTYIWYDPVTMEIIDCDVIMNTKHDWGIDPDGELEDGVTIEEFDVRNIVTHEAGHVVGLGDLYDKTYSELTMYGYSEEGETKKTSLEDGDKLGTQFLYGE